MNRFGSLAALCRVMTLLVACVVAVGCGSVTSASVTPHAYGDPLDPGPASDASACDRRIRTDEAVAARIRANLHVDGLAADPGAVKAAAADPTADISKFGIPLTSADLAAIGVFGIATDAQTPIDMWVNAGAEDLFGGIWVVGGTTVVAIVNGDPGTVALARCLAPPDTRYVWATVSQLEGQDVADRIGTDMAAWRGRGVEINTVDYDETTGVVKVGVSSPSDALLTELQARYGPLIRLDIQGPVIPA